MTECVELIEAGIDEATGDVLLSLKTATGGTDQVVFRRNVVGAIVGYLTSAALKYPRQDPSSRLMDAQPLQPTGSNAFVTHDGHPGLVFRLADGLELPIVFPAAYAGVLKDSIDHALVLAHQFTESKGTH